MATRVDDTIELYRRKEPSVSVRLNWTAMRNTMLLTALSVLAVCAVLLIARQPARDRSEAQTVATRILSKPAPASASPDKSTQRPRLGTFAGSHPGQLFSRKRSDPETVCGALTSDTLRLGPWQRSEAGPGWECFGSLQHEGNAVLFLVLRGETPDRIDRMFLKVDYREGNRTAEIETSIEHLSRTLAAFMDLALPPAIATGVRAGKGVSMSTQFARFRFQEDRFEAGRYHLSAVYGDAAAPQSSFVKSPAGGRRN